MSWHITKPCVQLIIIPNNEYGKYCLGAAARPEYGSVFRVTNHRAPQQLVTG